MGQILHGSAKTTHAIRLTRAAQDDARDRDLTPKSRSRRSVRFGPLEGDQDVEKEAFCRADHWQAA